MIIDFHTHTFPTGVSARAVEKLSQSGHIAYYTDASEEALLRSMAEAGITYSVNLPVVIKAEQTARINDRVLARREELTASGILPFGGLHPDTEDYRTELRRLREGGIRGIKLHPAFQGVDFGDPRFRRILAAAEEEGLITVIHAGEDVSFPGENQASVDTLLSVIHDIRPEKLVLAHMGGWQNWQEVQERLAGLPVYLDTAFALGPMEPRKGHEALLLWRENLSEEAFVSLVRAHGAERVLFATDSPWAEQDRYVAFIRRCPLTEEEKRAILGGNAARLLGLKE